MNVPVGVKLTALVQFVFAFYCGLVALIALSFTVFGGGSGGFFMPIGRGEWGIVTLISGALCAGFAGVGIGLVRRAKAARVVAIAFSLLAMLALWGGGSWTWLGIHAFIVGYLSFSESAAQAFR